MLAMTFKTGDLVVVINGDRYYVTKAGSYGRITDYDNHPYVEIEFINAEFTLPDGNIRNKWRILTDDIAHVTKLHKYLYGIQDDIN
jgi:hypothetical protein